MTSSPDIPDEDKSLSAPEISCTVQTFDTQHISRAISSISGVFLEASHLLLKCINQVHFKKKGG